MNQIMRIDRRDFLKGLLGASGGLLLAVRTLPAQASAGGPWQPSVYLSIAEDGIVRIVAHRSEMGTGIRTCLPAIVADELGADWAQVQIVQATGDAKYGSQNTDGSRSVRNFYDAMREAGATARTMLEQAAAQQWGVDSTAVTTLEHGVHHASSGKKAGFGELVAAAAALPVPSVEELRYRSPETYRYIGKNMPIVDRENITTGRAEYGMDVQLDGMKYAAVLHCPVLGGKVVSYDATEALKVPGVEQVVQMPEAEAPFAFHALGGLAIIASNTWAAFQGKAKLQVEWDYGPHADYDSETYRAELLQSVNTPGEVVLARGDVDAALAAAPTRHAADYYVPHLAHAPMEPPVALAHVTAEGCQAWAPTQNPQAAQDELATALGLDKEQVVVHVTLLGGGFGRKSKPDFIAEAALLSQKLQAPVKVVWSREDDIQHDYFHAVAACRVEAGLDAEGKAQAWLMRSAFPSIVSTFNPAADGPSAMELGLGFTDLPFAIDNVRGEKGKAAPHVRIGWLRSVANIYHAFAISSFADELADLAGADRVRAQFEGSAVFGASLALMGEISAKEGRVLQSNFHDYRVCRMHEAPKEIQVELVKSGAPPAGAGEPGVPPLAPALSNAIFAATGQRVRSLPLAAHDLSWS